MADKEQVIQALRATLISVKGALTIKQCNRDYRELQGEWIPYKKLGYPSLEKLFQDVPGFKITQVNGDWVVDAIASQETQHIASMVSRQKSNKKHNLKLNYPNRFPKKQGSWRKPTSSSYYDSNVSNQYSNYYNSNKSNKHNKTNDVKTSLQTGKNFKISTEHHDKTVVNNSKRLNATTQITRDNEEHKHSIKNEKETEKRVVGKISASQRLSNLRDRLNTVDLIPLQLPVHNDYMESGDLVTHAAPAHSLEPPPDSTSAVEKLEWTCRKLGLPQPTYKFIDIRPKRGSQCCYHCSIKVGSTYSVSSYPESSPSEELAKELAAVKLLAVIESSEAGGLATSGGAAALAGLAALLADRVAGVWATQVPHLYREKYRENLPNNWLELVENCPLILKERLVNGLVLLPNNEEVQTPLIESLSLEDTIDTNLPPLQFPEDDFWNVFITVANSTLEVWLRIIGVEYSDAFEVLLADMSDYYDHGGTSVDKSMIIKNAWYAVKLDDGGWQRAKIIEIEDEKATVFLGDHGDDDSVYFNNIKILETQFRKLPAQAVLCRLEGAEELAASEAGAALVRRRLPGEVLVAAPAPRTDPSDPSVAVVLYDTSTPRDLNLNKEIVHDFCMSGAFSLTQKLCAVEVGCVTEEGRVWVSRAGGADTVRAALALLTAGPYRRPLPAAPHAPPTQPDALYIVRTLAGDWVRCVIISGLDGEGTVRTQLVDSGLILRAPLSSLVPLNAFSPALDAYPHQAVQVRLGAAERVAGSMAARLRELLLGAAVLCRALPAPPADHVPHVELFVRSGPKNFLVPVNNSILMEYEYLQLANPKEEEKETTKHLEELSKKKERIFRTASSGAEGREGREAREGREGREGRPGALPPPALPAPGEYYDVYVAMAANPWNFVVQPISTRHTLQTMMAKLQIECPKIPESEAPTKPAAGELYTAYYDKDDSWYRVVIASAVSAEMVSVYFCDFGDLALLAARALRPVPAAAPLARSLPPQAVKARLYGEPATHVSLMSPVPAAAPLARSLPPQAVKARLYGEPATHVSLMSPVPAAAPLARSLPPQAVKARLYGEPATHVSLMSPVPAAAPLARSLPPQAVKARLYGEPATHVSLMSPVPAAAPLARSLPPQAVKARLYGEPATHVSLMSPVPAAAPLARSLPPQAVKARLYGEPATHVSLMSPVPAAAPLARSLPPQAVKARLYGEPATHVSLMSPVPAAAPLARSLPPQAVKARLYGEPATHVSLMSPVPAAAPLARSLPPQAVKARLYGEPATHVSLMSPVPAAAPLARSLPPQAVKARLYGEPATHVSLMSPVPAAAPLARSLPPQAVKARLYGEPATHVSLMSPVPAAAPLARSLPPQAVKARLYGEPATHVSLMSPVPAAAPLARSLPPQAVKARLYGEPATHVSLMSPVPAAAPLARSLPPQAVKARLYGEPATHVSLMSPVPAAAPLARSLPPQAVKARLYDVRPLHQDWTVEDCIRFQDLCVEQEFVSVCKEVGKDPLNPTEPLLTLDLIDTSTDEDIYINKQLVTEDRARLASAS